MMTEKKDKAAAFGGLAIEVRGGRRERIVRGLDHPDLCAAHVGDDQCKEPATIEVYGEPFCEVHGTEAAHGALESYYGEVGDEWGRLQSADAFATPKPADVADVVDAQVRKYNSLHSRHDTAREEAAKAAYPLEPGLVSLLTQEYEAFLDEGLEPDLPNPEDYYLDMLYVVQRAMRLAFYMDNEEAVDELRKLREYAAAQAEYARALGEKRYGTVEERVKKGGGS
jgi:hypothetical protein